MKNCVTSTGKNVLYIIMIATNLRALMQNLTGNQKEKRYNFEFRILKIRS